MKRALLLTASLLLCAPSGAQTPAPAQTAAPPQQPQQQPAAPPAGVKVEPQRFIPDEVLGRELRDLGGQPFRLADYRGGVYVVNLWASWCGPCHAEIPGLNKIYDDYRGRGVEFIGLTTEDPSTDSGRVREVVSELKMKYRVGWLDHETAASIMNWSPTRPGRFALPQTFVLAADGHVVLHVRGYNPRVPDMVRAGVRKALELSDPAAATPAAAPAPAAATPARPSARPATP